MSTLCASSQSLLRSLRSVSRSTKVPAPALARTYFSIHHPESRPFPDTQDRILSAAIDRVPQYGFTEDALLLGAKDAGYLDVTVQLFPRGVFDLINYYLVTQRLALKDNVQFAEGTKLGLTHKIKALSMGRLRANRDIIHQWQGVRHAHLSYSCNTNVLRLGTRPHVPTGKHSLLFERTERPLRRNLVPCG